MDKMKANINLKTVAGIGAGVALGHFVMKSKSPIVLIALGIGGGVIANQLIKTRGEKIEDAEKRAEDQAKMMVADIEETLSTEASKDADSEDITSDDEMSSSAEGMHFNKNVGYITPDGTVEEHDPSQYMDISF